MSSSAYIVGTGLTPFGDLSPATTLDLMSRAAQAALDDAGLERGAIDGLLVGYSTTFPHLMLSTAFAEHFGLAPGYAHGLQLGGATGLAMLAAARHLVVAGAARRILVVAGENRRSGQSSDQTISTLAQVGDAAHEVPNGGTVPAYYALVAERYLHETGCSEADLAELVVLMRRHAAAYPGAHYPEPVTVEEVLASRPIATPLKRLDCCPISDGAAALVVSAEPGPVPVRIAGTGQAHTHLSLMHAPDDIGAGARRAAAAAFAQAGRGPADVRLIGIYDSFSVTLAILLEACGFAAPGGSAEAVRAGRFGLDGPQPLNPHGGLLAYGHSGVAGGMAHAVEAARQMAGRSPTRAVADPACAFVHADGGVLSSHVSLVLERGTA
ncbi:Acetyl-CoA acetyltransferase [Tistlia consotensis]|uniref:Acetyl-CoA acetyltransferase n=1 Tax=Tistlia consotensis USBA 355 TaxID=560819 RepID=A0A1Y6BVT1_9PROT|nr:thiolase family protein [Tistlia consotensis]SMF30402.1 Acetyl-CoA acetyltransferase [Tistlia consotensis USBA 355]SNR90065.1 Acetyl-CoA acetyltransferase [Tistlia consotensis]